MLPCNVIVQENDSGTEISAINPYESMKSILADEIVDFSKDITTRLSQIIDSMKNR